MARGSRLVLLGGCGFDPPNPEVGGAYALHFPRQCLLAPVPDVNGHLQITSFADHDAVEGLGYWGMNWGQSLVLNGGALSLADTAGINAWRDSDGDDTYDPGEEGVYDVIGGYDSDCRRVAAVGDNGFQGDWAEYGGQALMRRLLRWVTGGTACEGIYLPLVVRGL